MRKYAAEPSFVTRLLEDRAELLAYARSVKSAEVMRAARADLMASTTIFVEPKGGKPVEYEVRDGVAQIPIMGELTPHAETDACGAYTAQALTEYGFIQAALIQAEDDPNVREIALNINSPGGYLDGLDETAQIMQAITKPMVANVSRAASAAYWLASQADRIVANSPAAEVGSIGIVVDYLDYDENLESQGIRHMVFTSTDAPDKRPDLKTEEGQAVLIDHLDALHNVFVRRVADGRGVSEQKVREDFGRGRMLIAEKALEAGMIDEVKGASYEKKTTAVGGLENKAAKAEETKGGDIMTLDQFKAEHPDVYAAARDEVIQAERKRVDELSAWKGINADADKAVDEAIAAGKNYGDVAAQLSAAVAKGNSGKADGENAPEVVSESASNGAGAQDLSDEDVEAMKIFGTSAEDYRKYRKGGK